MSQYSVKLDSFEGPLDLLLHLISKAEVDIYDIPVAQITDQYMGYIKAMQTLQLDIASEYLVMASTLLFIKSKMLLPKHEEELFDEENENIEADPREELIYRLIEYRRYKEAATQLQEREKERSLIFSKSPSDLGCFIEEKKEVNVNATVYDMLDAFGKMLKRKKIKMPKPTKIQRDDFPIELKMTEIIERLSANGGKLSFYCLFQNDSEKSQLIITFLAILELMKGKKIFCEQENNFSDITVFKMGG